MTTAPTILALDASSTTIGYVVYAGEVLAHGEHKLGGGDIATRCQTAYDILSRLLERYPDVDCVALESPVARYGSAVIAQSRVSGVLLLVVAQRLMHVIEVSPAAAKKILSGKGNADKATMQEKAKAYGVTGEHASDAVGIALAAAQQVEVIV